MKVIGSDGLDKKFRLSKATTGQCPFDQCIAGISMARFHVRFLVIIV